MWDVEYLSSDSDLNKAFVYLYRASSGILIQPMRRALKAAVEKQGYQLDLCSDDAAVIAVLGARSLFATPYVIWQVAPRAKIKDKIVNRVLKVMAAGEAKRFALFLPENSALTRRPLWPQVEMSSFVVREQLITHENLQPALSYLEQATSFASNLTLSSQQEFIDSFSDLLQEDLEMVDLQREFNMRVVIYTDLKQGRFDGDKFRRKVAEERRLSAVDRGLRDFLSGSDDFQLNEFLATLDWFYWRYHWNAGKLVNHIYRSCCRELRNVRQHKANWTPRRKRRAVGQDMVNYEMANRFILWSAIVMAWEGRLVEVASDAASGLRRNSDLSVTKLNQIAREFIERSSATPRSDRLTGLWASLSLTLSRVGLSELSLYKESRERLPHLSEADLVDRVREWQLVRTRRYSLVCALVEILEFLPVETSPTYWICRLRAMLEQAKTRMSKLIEVEG